MGVGGRGVAAEERAFGDGGDANSGPRRGWRAGRTAVTGTLGPDAERAVEAPPPPPFKGKSVIFGF